VWPTIESALRRVLAARHVPTAEWDDFLQEVATRMFVSNVDLRFATDLLPWATTVLRRMHIDFLRRQGRQQWLPDGERRTQPGVDAAVMARLDLARVAAVVSTWSPEARAVLFENDAVGTRRPTSFYTSRHRLRARLLAAIEGVAAFGPLASLRSRLRRVDAVVADHASAAANFVLPSAAAACLSLAIGFAPPVPTPAAGSSLASLDVTRTAAVTRTAGDDGRGAGAVDGVRSTPSTAEDAGRLAGSRAAAPRHHIVWSPVETRAQVAAGPASPYVEVENNEEVQPLYCVRDTGVVADHCVDHPIYSGPVAPLLPPF